MNSLLSLVNEIIFIPNKLFVSDFQVEKESQEYGACRFEIGNQKIISRNAKRTPTKTGQFVTIWKRNTNGETCPFDETDDFDLLLINAQYGQNLGQFIFPKELLVAKGIISNGQEIGKRGINTITLVKPTKPRK